MAAAHIRGYDSAEMHHARALTIHAVAISIVAELAGLFVSPSVKIPPALGLGALAGSGYILARARSPAKGGR